MTPPDDAPQVDGPDGTVYVLTLFVSGATDPSARAIANARRLCETHLEDRYELSVVDMRHDPAAALSHQVLAAPTLLKHRPLPVRRIVGDLSQTDKVLLALHLPAATGEGTSEPHPRAAGPAPVIEVPAPDVIASSKKPDNAYLTAAEAAVILNVGPKTITRWAKEGKLGYRETLGGHRRFFRREVDLLAEQSVVLPEVTAR